jgi:pimeloyl-ACP methyl ester carboxylesterase
MRPNNPRPPEATGFMKRHLKIAVILPILFGPLLLTTCSPLRGYQAALVLADIAAGDGPSLLKRTTPEPSRMTLRFSWQEREYLADLYQPGETALAAVLLMPGIDPAGKDDPRLVAFATTLARARFNVLVPDLASLRELRVNTGNIREVADVFSWLVVQPLLAPAGRTGIIAFSYGAGPVILAAMEPALRKRVRFIMTVGAYYDLRQVLTFFTTGWFRAKGTWHHRTPNAFGKWVFVLSNVERLPDPSDRRILRTMARRKLRNLGGGVEDLAAKLSPSGRAVYDFIVNKELSQAPRLIAGLPESIKKEIRALNLADKDLHRLRARLILVHGYDDDIIPYSQSIELAHAVSPGQARLFLANGLAHVDLEPGLLDKWELWRAVDALLGQRED